MSDDHWSKFHWLRWRGNPNLSRCSKAAKGVWMDMLSLMFSCEVRGVLSTGDEPWSDHEIAGAIGGDIAENLAHIRELTEKRVAKRNNQGAIFSSRMVAEEQIRRERVKAGELGGYAKSSKRLAKRKQRGKQTLSNSVSNSSSSALGNSGNTEDSPSRAGAREADPVWDAVAGLFFPGGIAGKTKARAGKVVSELKNLGATADQVQRRTENLRKAWPKLTITPEALVKHWATREAMGGPDSWDLPDGIPFRNPTPEEIAREAKYA